MASVVSPRFGLLWVVTIPFTLTIVGLYFLWEKGRLRLYVREDADLERNLERIEGEIISAIRIRTLSKVNTWISRNKRKAGLAADEENDYGASKGSAVPVFSNVLAVFLRSG